VVSVVVVGVVVVVVVGVVVVVVLELEEVVVVGVLVELVEVVVGVVVPVVAFWQSLAASWPTVVPPWSRSARSVRLIVPGRLRTASLNCREADDAAPQSREFAAFPTWSSWFDNELA
jgi:hypothetical protein